LTGDKNLNFDCISLLQCYGNSRDLVRRTPGDWDLMNGSNFDFDNRPHNIELNFGTGLIEFKENVNLER
jgi:hypothetical protein